MKSLKSINEVFSYDKEKYIQLILDAAETVLGYFGFDRIVYGIKKYTGTRKWRWLEELKHERKRYQNRDGFKIAKCYAGTS